MSRILLYFIFIFFAALPANGTDTLMGTVTSLDPESGNMCVRPEDGYSTPPPDRPEDGSGQPHEAVRDIKVLFPPDRFPACIRIGGPVRLWGDFDPKNSELFHAQHIRSGGDWTGVRSRIGRCGKSGCYRGERSEEEKGGNGDGSSNGGSRGSGGNHGGGHGGGSGGGGGSGSGGGGGGGGGGGR